MGSVCANEGHLKLLAIKDSENGYEGTTADLYLEIQPGNGRVFLDTFPLTKVDTQISTRFARDIACSFLSENCQKYDFIYTIRADSPIVAGPSAGGAITLLTMSLLSGIPLSDEISITGTINSGGIIGPVGGIKEKLDAASAEGIKKVLIPEGERYIEGENESNLSGVSNNTLDLVEYGKSIGLKVIEVSDINEALYQFSGKKLENDNYSLVVDLDYNSTMASLANELCNRSKTLIEKASFVNSSMEDALNFTRKGNNAIVNGRYYSAASYCFGANVKLTNMLLESGNLSPNQIEDNLEILDRNIKKLDDSIEQKRKTTLTDLEAYSVVKERLLEAKESKKEIVKNTTNFYSLAYSSERVYSAFSWAKFFDHRGKKYDFNTALLKSSCQSKIEEAQERYNYVQIFYPVLGLDGTKSEIDYAYDDLKSGNYELCIFKATMAKSESDIILSVSGIGTDKITSLLDKKIATASKNVGKQIAKGSFPVLAYSYFEYANELKTYDPYSALLYAEYAIELSNLDMYFHDGESPISLRIEAKPLIFLSIGILIGFILSLVIKGKKKYNPSRASKKALPGKKR